MRICLISMEIFAWGKHGGFGRATRIIGRELAKRGVQVFAVVPRRGEQRPVELLDGITVLGFEPAMPWRAGPMLKSCDADIYHSEEPSFTTWLAQRAMPGRKHIVTLRDTRELGDWMTELRLPLDVIKGVVAVSGPYDLRQATGFVADYLPDPATRAGASPLLHVAAGAPPMIVAFGTLEAPYVKGSPELVDALVRAGADARLIPLAGMQHDATALSLGHADGAVVRAMLVMMH